MELELVNALQLLHEQVANTFELFKKTDTSEIKNIAKQLYVLWEEIDKAKKSFVKELNNYLEN